MCHPIWMYLLALVVSLVEFPSGIGCTEFGVEEAEGRGSVRERLRFRKKSDLSPNVGEIQELDPEDFPISGLTPQQALDLLFDRYKARMLELHEPRMVAFDDLSQKEVGEICGSHSSLECGKKVLEGAIGDISSNPNIHRKCNLRKDFLACIDIERSACRHSAEKGVYPRLPPKSIIRSTQSKIWRALWTSGGCVLAD